MVFLAQDDVGFALRAPNSLIYMQVSVVLIDQNIFTDYKEASGSAHATKRAEECIRHIWQGGKTSRQYIELHLNVRLLTVILLRERSFWYAFYFGISQECSGYLTFLYPPFVG
jgi:hypothetical protein